MKPVPNHIEKARAAHHAALATLFPAAKCTPINLWRRLRRIEAKAHKWAEMECNGEPVPEEWSAGIRADVIKQCGSIPAGFFVNGDPRGYALKLDLPRADMPAGLVTDMGDFGILAAVIE